MFTFLLMGFVLFNNLIPNPRTPLIEAFTTLGGNIQNCELYDNDIEDFAYHFTNLIKDEEKLKIITLYLEQQNSNMLGYWNKHMKSCKKILKTVILNEVHIDMVCRQLLENSERVLGSKNEMNMLHFRIYSGFLTIKKQYLKSNKNFLKFSSEQGAFLNDNLFQNSDECFWDQAYQSCSPGTKELERLRKEDFFGTTVERRLKQGRKKQIQKISKIKSVYASFKSEKIYQLVIDGKLDIYNMTNPIHEQLVKDFKPVAVELVIRRINNIISRFRDLVSNPDLSQCLPEDIAYGVHIDLKNAFKRCTRKYFYSACSKVNRWSVSFKCFDGSNDSEKQNVTTYSHKCEMLYFRSSQRSLDPNFGFSGNYKGAKNPVMAGAIFPWMLGD